MLNFWQRTRLIIETKTYLSLLPPAILFGLFIALFTTDNLIFLYFLVGFSVGIVGGLIGISKITDDWWYHKYDNNKWGHSRQLIQALKDIRKELK